VDVDDGESDEAEFGDVGEDNVGEDNILFVLFDNFRDWLNRSPLNVRGDCGRRARDCEGGARQSSMGWLFDPEAWTAFCALMARQKLL